MKLKSLDPRVERLPDFEASVPKPPLDQFGTYEVFVKGAQGKEFQHEGIVHAPNREMAFMLAKEAFTRRFTCISLFITETQHVFTSAISEGTHNIYELIPDKTETSGDQRLYEVFHLVRRGKQSIRVGKVSATSPKEALSAAKEAFNSTKIIYQVWVIPQDQIRYTKPDESILWLSLSEKKFRDASDYKGGDKLKDFLDKQATIN